jgi:hypothetical protein
VAIYRPSRPRWPGLVLAALIGLVVGAGAALAFSARRGPDTAAVVAAARAALLEARGTLEVAAIEYRESVRGTQIVRRSEYRGARAALERSRRSYLRARPALRALAAPTASKIDRTYDRLDRMMRATAPPQQVTITIARLGAALGETVGA